MGSVFLLKRFCKQKCVVALSLVFFLFTVFKWIGSFSYHSNFQTVPNVTHRFKFRSGSRSSSNVDKEAHHHHIHATTMKSIDGHSHHSEQYNVLFLFDNAQNNQRLQTNFKNCISSMLSKASRPLRIHIAGDLGSFQVAQEFFKNSTSDGYNIHNSMPMMIHHDKNQIETSVLESISFIHQQISGKSHHFSDPLFYLSILLHKIVPNDMGRIILLDIDLIFLADIIDLFLLFDSFKSEQIIGIARENQPVYRHLFWDFRSKHNNTRVGEPPPNGLTGFNSGVLLLHLDHMRHSSVYTSFFSIKITELVKKYEFQGGLGDQDFFTLISLEHEELFYILPCGWNRQLCMWWKQDDFIQVFDQYFECLGPIHIMHGNCKTSLKNYIPN